MSRSATSRAAECSWGEALSTHAFPVLSPWLLRRFVGVRAVEQFRSYHMESSPLRPFFFG